MHLVSLMKDTGLERACYEPPTSSTSEAGLLQQSLLSEQKLQRNLVLVNDLFKSKWSVANCMTDRASVHTGNASEQFLHPNRTLILVHTVPEQHLKRSKNLSGTV